MDAEHERQHLVDEIRRRRKGDSMPGMYAENQVSGGSSDPRTAALQPFFDDDTWDTLFAFSLLFAALVFAGSSSRSRSAC